MKRPTFETVAAAGALVLLAAVAIVTSRAATPPRDGYASTDFGAGGYRAWSALLTREGVATSRFVLRPIELDAQIDTLISAQPLPQLTDPAGRTAADLDALAQWVRAGGRLVYIGRNAALRSAETRSLELPALFTGTGARAGLTGPLAARVGSLSDAGPNRMRLVGRASAVQLADGNGAIVVRSPLGLGEVIAVADALPFTNARIGAAGNARLAYLIGVPRAAGGVVAFDDGVHGALIDRPWYRALPLSARVSLGILALAGVLALVGVGLPLGAPVSLRAVREPTSEEFVVAVAALHERIHARSAAAAILARDALTCAARASGLPDTAAPADVAARLGERVSAGDVGRLAALLGAPVANDAELIASARLAYTVRKECSHGGNRDGRRTAFAGRDRARRRR